MNPNAGVVLLIPLIGLVSICRSGKWHWDPIGLEEAAWLRPPFLRRLLLVVFWLGWSSSLIVGLSMLFGWA